MFVAHLSSGYIVSKLLLNKRNISNADYTALLIVGIVASIVPDLDLLYFYFIDNRQHAHHSYWTHMPFFWLLIYSVVVIVAVVSNSRRSFLFGTLFTASVLMHLVLDTLAGGIFWLYPYSNESYVLFTIPATYDWWVWNFILHWSFGFELLIIAISVHMFRQPRHRVLIL